MQITPLTLLLVCPLVFAAGFVDAVAGGGGLISLPAYLLAGLPAHLAAGTNKFASSTGTFVASVRFLLSGKVAVRQALTTAVFSVLGALLGTSLALRLPEKGLHLVLLLSLPCIAVFLAFRRDFGAVQKEKRLSRARQFAYTCLIGLGLGVYDGLIGPGTGTLLILCFTSLLGYDLILSSGCAKICNLASNAASLFLNILNGKVLFALGLPAAACAMLGGYLGARLAVRGGVKWVRFFIFFVLILLFIKTGFDLFTNMGI